jgi:GNAT superfamily N-acetyltransferase
MLRVLSELHPEWVTSATLPAVRQGSRSFVAEVAGAVVGVAVATFVDYGPSSYGMVEELVVSASHRGRGLGGELLDACRSWLAEAEVEVVFVSAVDAEAVGFYEAAGFRPCTGPWLHLVFAAEAGEGGG